MKSLLLLRFLSPLAWLGWPLVRIAAGLLLFAHGFDKVTGGVGGFATFLASKGVPAPEVAAWTSALTELVGGACLAIGLFTRPVGAVIAFNMAVALLLSHTKDLAHVGHGGAGVPAEYPLLLGVIGVAAAFAGAGRLSVDACTGRPPAA